ncbi:MAG: phosphatase PAP2 family protein [Thermoanaerobaculia bacterium]
MSSTGGVEERPRRGEVATAIAFVVLLLLSVGWPAPLVWLNDLTLDAPLDAPDGSFLGREPPLLDVLFWMLAGIFALALFHGRTADARAMLPAAREELARVPGRVAAAFRALDRRTAGMAVFAAAAAVAMIWFLIDAPVIEVAEAVRSPRLRSAVRAFNRLSGGANPVMIVGFFLLAGLALRVRRWIRASIAMALAGVSAGILVHVLKYIVGRTRPELWLGPFHHVAGRSSSFPSGHTASAFAIATVVVMGTRTRGVKVVAIAIALAVAVARVVALRHWPSDVVAAALIGSAAGWFFATALAEPGAGYASISANETETSREQPASSIVTP